MINIINNLYRIIVVLLIGISNVYAHISCTDVPISSISTVNTPVFHNFSEVGVTGAVLFVPVNPGLCIDSTGDPLASSVYMVIDDYDGGSSLKSLWASTLLTAKASANKVDFHATDLGVNSRGYQVIRLYYLKSK